MAITKTHAALTGHLPMRPHLLTFIQKKENLRPGQGLLMPGDSVIGGMLDNLLVNKTALRDDKRDRLPVDFRASLPFVIQDSRVTWGDMFITNTRIIRFNSLVSSLMHEMLFADVLRALRSGQQEKEAIYRFINDYEIYECNFDALKKASLRWRERRGFPLFREKKSQKKGLYSLGNSGTVPQAAALAVNA